MALWLLGGCGGFAEDGTFIPLTFGPYQQKLFFLYYLPTRPPKGGLLVGFMYLKAFIKHTDLGGPGIGFYSKSLGRTWVVLPHLDVLRVVCHMCFWTDSTLLL